MLYNPFSLKNKTVLITGASSGIGQTTAIECSKLGAKVIITGRNEERLTNTYSLLQGEGHRSISVDLTLIKDIDTLINSLPKLDGVVLSAGINKMSIVRYIQEDDLSRIFEINTFSPIIITQRLLKNRKLNNPSSIVFIGSASGIHTNAIANSMYGASKAAIYAFTRHAGNELGTKGIRCNSVHPGFVYTPMTKTDREFTDEDIEKNKEMYPLNRYGEPEDIAFGIIYLLSDAAAWVTGESLVIDGGVSLRK